ncbi:spore germination protein [Virgibacillus sediminis]|uniref:Spore germination protein n=1 Tax=Virgibacillus sediminis TaxID=202260 RepID=A0ABV7A9B8_9BACI
MSGRRFRMKKQGQATGSGSPLKKDLQKNLSDLKAVLGEPDDLVVRKFTLSGGDSGALVYLAGISDKDMIHNNILKNLQFLTLPEKGKKLGDVVYREVVSITDVTEKQAFDEVMLAVLAGDTALLIDGTDTAVIMGTAAAETRSIEQPPSEPLIRGPRDGFNESINTNLSLIRQEVRDENLRFKHHQIGRRARKKLVVSYIEGIAHPDMVKEVNRRLESIDIDFAPESGYIEQSIEDSFLSPFPQMLNTERPDRAIAHLMEGKVIILLDGTPFVLIAPVTLANTLQSPEDYYERWIVGTLIRVLRYLAVFLSLFLPSLYIALVSYHPGMIPSDLAFSISATREGVPFPSFIEAVLMGVTMELLREAGARLPTGIGQTIGIVGGLVIGEAAVGAGIVSPIMVIIVALTAIASFTNPAYSVAIAFRMMRFGFMIAAAFLGLYGIVLLYIAINVHLVNLKSFGIPYTAPFSPSFPGAWKDLVLRAPMSMMTRRPAYMWPADKKSGSSGRKQK